MRERTMQLPLAVLISIEQNPIKHSVSSSFFRFFFVQLSPARPCPLSPAARWDCLKLAHGCPWPLLICPRSGCHSAWDSPWQHSETTQCQSQSGTHQGRRRWTLQWPGQSGPDGCTELPGRQWAGRVLGEAHSARRKRQIEVDRGVSQLLQAPQVYLLVLLHLGVLDPKISRKKNDRI